MPPSRPAGRASRGSRTGLARIVALILEHAENEGMNRAELLEAAGLEGLDLTRPDSRVPLAAEVALWRLMARATSDSGVGVRVGQSVHVRDFGLLGYAVYYSGTLGAALRRIERYHRILTDGIQVTLTTPDAHHVALGEPHTEIGTALPYAVDFRLAATLGSCREITGVEVVPSAVDFTYPQPANTVEHRRFFRSPLRFNQPVSQLIFEERDFALPVARADEALAGYLSEHTEQVLRTLTSGTSTREQVRSAIWALLGEGRPTLRRIAAVLQIPERTLQRRLAQEGSSLQKEIEHIRMTMATASLRHNAGSVQEIAFLLGYRETSTFYRSFRRWTGKTPQRYRRAPA